MSPASEAFDVLEAPCPTCRRHRVVGLPLRDDRYTQQHTRYVCTYWGSSAPCGWTGWTVHEPQESEGRR